MIYILGIVLQEASNKNKLLKPFSLGLDKPIFIYQDLLNLLIFIFYDKKYCFYHY